MTRIGVLVVSILVLSAFLGGVTLDTFNRATTEERIQERVVSEVDDPRSVVGVEVQQSNAVLFQRPEHVVVTVGSPPGTEPPGLADRLDSIVDDAAGRDVETSVRYVVVERA